MKFTLPQELLIQFYTAVVKSVLCTSITVWLCLSTRQAETKVICKFLPLSLLLSLCPCFDNSVCAPEGDEHLKVAY